MNDIDISKRIREIRFSIASPDMIRAMGTTQITIPELYENNCPKFSGLFDLRMGTQDNLFLCKTCKNNMKDCSGHFGYIDLARKVYFIHFLPTVKKILQCVCYKCSNLLIDKTNINMIKKLKKKVPNIRMKIIYKMCASQSKKTCTNYNGCGRLQPRYIKEGTNLFVVHKIANPDGKPLDKKAQLNADDCYDILRKISDEDCELLGCSPIFSRPEWLICSVLPVPPPCVRPSVKHDANLRSEDDLTYKLLDIIKANNSLMVKVKSNDQNHINDYIDYLQYNITTLIDNEVKGIPPAQQRTGRLLKSIRQRLKGKEGRIRGNIMGKRVNFSARSVISPDPNIDIDELGVPLKIAMNMTFPEVVNVYNIHALTTLVENGPEKHPGAKYIIKKNKDRLDLRYVKDDNITLECGDVVERHMVDGDIVLFNRQPSLHKMSMMGHRVRVMPYSTFRLNVAVTTPYNADFDGDEMNLYLAQSVVASTEIEELVCVPNQIISPQSNKPVIGCIMDTVVGANNITRKSTQIKFKEIMNMLPHISTFDGNLPPFKVERFNNKHIPDNIYLEGREIFSLLLPSEVNYFKSMDDEDNIEVINGNLITGKCSKAVTGTSGGSLVHIIQNDLGRDTTKRFLTEIQGVTGTWLMKNGFSVGIGDCLPDSKTKDYINNTISKAKANVKNIISATISSRLKLETGMSIREEFEGRILNILNTARDDAGGLATKKLGDDNAIKNMVTSGSKGNFINISQIMASVGQQNVSSGAKSGRIPCGYRNRTLPHFQKYDDGPESKGFVENSFLSGLTPYEFFFHAMSGREGLIDTAVKTSETGYIQRRLMKAMEDIKVHYDMTVRNERDQIIQFIYGDDGFDATRIEKQKIEILKYNNKIFSNKYKWKKKELKQNMDKKSYKQMKKNNDFEEILDKEFTKIQNYRNYLRKINHEDISYSPVHIYRIIKQAKNGFNINNKSISNINPIDIITKVEEVCSSLRVLISDDDIIKEINKKSMKNFKMLLRTKLSSKMVIMEHKLNLLSFDWIISKIYEQFEKSLVQPGEMVGSITAQSIGEPATQMTLNTFHLSGVAAKSKITRGVPRLRELINVSKNPKTPSITVYLDKDISKNKDEAKKIINDLQYTNLRYFVIETSIHYDPDIYKKSTNITKDKEFVEEYYDIYDNDVGFENLSPWVLRIEFDHQYMLDKQFTMFQIYEHLLTKYDSKKIQVIFTDDCAKTLVLHIRFMYQNISKEITDLDQKKLRDFEQIVINDSAVKGLKNIDKAFMREIKTVDYKKNGDKYNVKEWIIETNGTNLAICLCNPLIDSTRTISNDIHEVKEIFGIEASRTILFEEIKQVIGDSGIYINDRHLNILVDVMTNKGYIMSIDRHGINRSERGPLVRSSFEETTDQLVKAGVYSQVDNMVSVTANIMTGQKAKFGTHMSSIIQDMKLIIDKGIKPVEIPREKKTIFSLKQIIS
jgi:DNA-directed RNA polymerase II subunit RPB1